MRAALLSMLLLVLVPATASAHLVESGFGNFYDGALHLIVTPGDLLIVVGIALLGGLHGAAVARAMLVGLLAGWVAGALNSFALTTPFSSGRLDVLAFGMLGVLVLLDKRLAGSLIIAISIAIGVAQGLGAALSVREQAVSWLWLTGALSSLAIIATLLAALVVAARVGWMRVAARAVGSWLAAVSVLMLGWALR